MLCLLLLLLLRHSPLISGEDEQRFFSDDGLEFTDVERSPAFYTVAVRPDIHVASKQVTILILGGQAPREAVQTFCRGVGGCGDGGAETILSAVLEAAPQLKDDRRLAPVATRLNVSDSTLAARLTSTRLDTQFRQDCQVSTCRIMYPQDKLRPLPPCLCLGGGPGGKLGGGPGGRRKCRKRLATYRDGVLTVGGGAEGQGVQGKISTRKNTCSKKDGLLGQRELNIF